MTELTDHADAVDRDLLNFVLGCISEDEATAQAAGHGFGHRPLLEDRNAGWTDLDLSENCRPSYDASFLRAFSPDRILDECELKRFMIQVAPTRTQLLVVLARFAELYSDRRGFRDEWSVLSQLDSLRAAREAAEGALPIPNKES